MTEDEMVGWHHRLMDMSLNKLPEIVKEGKPANHGGRKESDMTERLKRTELKEMQTHAPL